MNVDSFTLSHHSEPLVNALENICNVVSSEFDFSVFFFADVIIKCNAASNTQINYFIVYPLWAIINHFSRYRIFNACVYDTGTHTSSPRSFLYSLLAVLTTSLIPFYRSADRFWTKNVGVYTMKPVALFKRTFLNKINRLIELNSLNSTICDNQLFNGDRNWRCCPRDVCQPVVVVPWCKNYTTGHFFQSITLILLNLWVIYLEQ